MLLKLQMGINIQDNVQLTDELEGLYSKKQTAAVEATPDLTKRPEYRLLQQQVRLYELSKKRYQYGYADDLDQDVPFASAEPRFESKVF